MTYRISLLVVTFMLAACSSRSGSTPAQPVVQPVKQNQDIQSAQLVESSRSELNKAKELLANMGCELSGKDIECPTPINYKQSKDLKVALDGYAFALGKLRDQVQQNEKVEINSQWNSTQHLLNETKQLMYGFTLNDHQEVIVANSRLLSKGFKWSTVSSMSINGSGMVTKLTIDKQFLREHYSKSDLRNELNSFIQTVEWFLNIYSDGQNVLKSEILREQQQKLSLAKDLAATFN